MNEESKISKPDDLNEQRAFKRVRVNMKIAYRNNDNNYKMGKVCNLSRGGMFVDTMISPDVDGFVMASLDVEEFGKIIWVRGQVVRKTNSGMAISFARTDDKGLNNLLSYWSVPF
jgi:hypothetical protein